MLEQGRLGGKSALAGLLLLLCSACADQNGALREACAGDAPTPKPAACGGDLQRQIDDVTRATTDIQRVRQHGGHGGR